MKKTNVMRILDSKNIKYDTYTYNFEDKNDIKNTSELINKPPEIIYKTLVTKSNRDYYVFIIPINEHLDLKKAANSVNEKKIEMIKEKELYPLTGYVHGGCSPIGMKKFFKTTFHDDIKTQREIIFNGGKVGVQIKVNVSDIEKVIEYEVYDLIKN